MRIVKSGISRTRGSYTSPIRVPYAPNMRLYASVRPYPCSWRFISPKSPKNRKIKNYVFTITDYGIFVVKGEWYMDNLRELAKRGAAGSQDIPGGAGSAGLATAPVELDAQALLRLSEISGLGLELVGVPSGCRETALKILSGMSGKRCIELGVDGSVNGSGASWVEVEAWLEKSSDFATLFGLAERALDRAMRSTLKRTLFARALNGFEVTEIRASPDKSGFEKIVVNKIDNTLGRYLLQELESKGAELKDEEENLDRMVVFPSKAAAKKHLGGVKGG